MRASKARRLQALIEALADYLTDDEALEALGLFPQWCSTAGYMHGKRVRYEGKLYRCLQDHQAQESWDPEDAPTLWARVLPGNPPLWIQPEPSSAYAKGDKVTHNGGIWVSLNDDNSWEPGIFGWEETA